MNNFLPRLVEFGRKAAILARKGWEDLKRLAGLAFPPSQADPDGARASFLPISLLSWSIGDKVREAILYFPAVRGWVPPWGDPQPAQGPCLWRKQRISWALSSFSDP